MPSAVAVDVRPTFFWAPPAVASFGADAADLAESAGLLLDPWQRFALDHILAEDERGLPAAFEACVLAPRQNGKGSILEALSLAWLFLTDVPLVLHSAHEFKTAREAFRRLQSLIMGAPHLSRRVARVTTGAGNEGIELSNGQRLSYVARSKGSGRGFTGGKLILDEAYAISADEMAALLPTLSTQPEAQVVYTSSAGMATSDHMRAIRDRGRSGGDPSLCYLEWGGVAPCPDRCQHLVSDARCALNDQDLWRRANPSADIPGHGIPLSFIAKERRAFQSTPEKFARERLGVWDEVSAKAAPFTLADWTACHTPTPVRGTDVVFALDLAWNRSGGSIAAATRGAQGVPLVELVRYTNGPTALVDEAADLARRYPNARWVGCGAVESIRSDLRKAGVSPRMLKPAEVESAHGQLQDAVRARSMVHNSAELDAVVTQALEGAVRKDTETGWVWTRRKSGQDGVDISPLYAVTLAHYVLSSGHSTEVY